MMREVDFLLGVRAIVLYLPPRSCYDTVKTRIIEPCYEVQNFLLWNRGKKT